jgi:hypothetical protein
VIQSTDHAADNYFRWGRKKVANMNRNSIMLSVSGIQMDLRDVAYYVKRKQGTLKITDQGLADIFLGGSGFSFKIKMSTAEKSDRQNFFKVDKVDVDVKNFNIKLKQSKHKVVFGLFKPFMLKVLRPALQKAIEKQIKDQVHQLDTFAWQIKQEADRAQKEVSKILLSINLFDANDLQALKNPDQAANIYQRYVTAAQKQFMQGKNQAQAMASDKKVNMAMTKHDSIFPNIHLPGGISSKATEYKNMAMEGSEWRSPIFKLGSASTSSNIPAATNITRKEHSVTKGGVRGPQSIGNTGSMTNQLNDPAAQSAGTTNGSAVNGSANFSNQVDNAFSPESTPVAALNGKTTNGSTTVTNGNTTLGANNPVITGRT